MILQNTVFIGVGANLGNRQKNISDALELLRKNPEIIIEKISSLIETEPVGGPLQGKYLNAVIKINTSLQPRELLNVLQAIERGLGRIAALRNGPRTIDLDILLYADLIINLPDLIIPHPRMRERDFVMKPLLEIEPNLLNSYGKHIS